MNDDPPQDAKITQPIRYFRVVWNNPILFMAGFAGAVLDAVGWVAKWVEVERKEMTPEIDLERIDSVIDSTNCVAADSLSMGRKTIKSLVADSRALREFVAALPKCVACKIRPATRHRWHEDFYCDAHDTNPDLSPLRDLKTAAITRKLGL